MADPEVVLELGSSEHSFPGELEFVPLNEERIPFADF
jgi:hypothetical protein